jgi:hypothetical protein
VRNCLVCACVALISASAAFGQQTAKPAGTGQDAGAKQPGPSSTEASKSATKQASSAAADQKLADLLESKIRAAWAAFKNKNKQAYGDFLTHDYMAVEDDGQGERTKMVVLREVGESNVYDYKLQLFRTDPIAPDAALVTYENVIEFPPKAGSRFEKIFISEIWLKRNGQWKSWRYQATKVK